MRRKKSTPESSNSLIKELSSVEFIKQPYLYAMVGADFSLYQRSIMIEIVKSMQDRINEFLKNKRADGQMSLFPKDLSDDQIVTFRISASSIGVSPRDYVYLDEACKNLMEMNISYYDYDQMGRKMRTYAHLFSTIKMPVTPVSGSKEKEKRMNYVEARMDAKILKYLCDLGNGKGYLDHIYRIARICKRKRTPSIYIYLSRWKDFPKKTVEYVELKKFLGVITLEEEKVNGKMVKTEKDKYPKFSKFCKEVMDPIREDLDRMASENLVDFTFDYEPVYKGATKRGNPDEILFNIKLSELGEEMSRKRRQQKLPADIWDLLRSEYKLTETDVRMLTDMLPDELMNEFRSEVLALRDRMNRYKVNNPKSYVVTSLKNFIIQHTPEAKEAKEDERVGEKKETPHTKPISEEDKNRWQAFMELLQGSVSVNEFKTWLSSLEFVSLKGDEVTVSVPAAYVATYIDEKLNIPFIQALNAVYGENVKLLYEVRK
nr:MAG TPA: DNA REPLICATION protein [Caudoviricetes sp.]